MSHAPVSRQVWAAVKIGARFLKGGSPWGLKVAQRGAFSISTSEPGLVPLARTQKTGRSIGGGRQGEGRWLSARVQSLKRAYDDKGVWVIGVVISKVGLSKLRHSPNMGKGDLLNVGRAAASLSASCPKRKRQ